MFLNRRWSCSHCVKIAFPHETAGSGSFPVFLLVKFACVLCISQVQCSHPIWFGCDPVFCRYDPQWSCCSAWPRSRNEVRLFWITPPTFIDRLVKSSALEKSWRSAKTHAYRARAHVWLSFFFSASAWLFDETYWQQCTDINVMHIILGVFFLPSIHGQCQKVIYFKMFW